MNAGGRCRQIKLVKENKVECMIENILHRRIILFLGEQKSQNYENSTGKKHSLGNKTCFSKGKKMKLANSKSTQRFMQK